MNGIALHVVTILEPDAMLMLESERKLIDDIIPRVIRHEGFRRHAYRDSLGIWTIGYGRNLENVGLRPDEVALMLANDAKEGTLEYEIDLEHGPQLAVYRDLVREGIRDDEATLMLKNDMRDALRIARGFADVAWNELDDVRKGVLIEMAYNLGSRLYGFRNMRRAVQEGDFDRAASEMLDSMWARQVGIRATRLAEIMRTGKERNLL